MPRPSKPDSGRPGLSAQPFAPLRPGEISEISQHQAQVVQIGAHGGVVRAVGRLVDSQSALGGGAGSPEVGAGPQVHRYPVEQVACASQLRVQRIGVLHSDEGMGKKAFARRPVARVIASGGKRRCHQAHGSACPQALVARRQILSYDGLYEAVDRQCIGPAFH